MQKLTEDVRQPSASNRHHFRLRFSVFLPILQPCENRQRCRWFSLVIEHPCQMNSFAECIFALDPFLSLFVKFAIFTANFILEDHNYFQDFCCRINQKAISCFPKPCYPHRKLMIFQNYVWELLWINACY